MPRTPKCASLPDLPPPKPYVSYRARDVARYTGLSARLILRDCQTGKIRHNRIGKAVTIPGSEILRLNGQAA